MCISKEPGADLSALSPMMRQYLQIKEQNPDNILFFRLGDFYEMFYDDAKVAASELDLTLTGKDCGTAERAPMCGVPYHSCEGYIARLVARGYKVAICEQTEDPANARGIVKRDVVRVITPGTVIEDSMLDESRNNYLAAVSLCGDTVGVCFAEASTGSARVTQFSGSGAAARLTTELGRYRPSELLFPAGAETHPAACFARDTLATKIEWTDSSYYAEDTARERLCAYFSVGDLTEIGLNADQTGCVTALYAAVRYLNETQMSGLSRLHDVRVYSADRFMRLDLSAIRNLELFETLRSKEKRGSLLWLIDRTKSAMGKRLIRAWLEQPLTDPDEINRRQDAVEEFVSDFVFRGEVREYLAGIRDLERLVTRVVCKTATARELIALKDAFACLPVLKDALRGCKSVLLSEIYRRLDTMEDAAELIRSVIADDPPGSVREGNIIKPGYNEELDSLRGDLDGGQGVILELERRERENTGIKSLKIRYNKVFGYAIEVPNAFADRVPESYVRKQTLTNCERYVTDELKRLESRIVGARERSTQLEYSIFLSVCERIAAMAPRVQNTASAVAELDVLASFAEVSATRAYVRPVFNTEGFLRITDGRHPVVEAISGQPFVPNDTVLDLNENRCAILTGPNMAGKSTYMRQVALITVLAHIGCFVPAGRAEIPVTDAVFTRVGASDDLAAGQSTFSVEMSEVADIVKNATRNSLLILDEIGRGTSTYDGMAIARAVLEYIADPAILGAKTLFATHYHELTRLEGQLNGVKNYRIAVKKRGDDLIFLRRVVRGGADESYGVEVAKLSGVPEAIIRRAKVILTELESREETAAPASPARERSALSVSGMLAFVEQVRGMDANTVTPIEALSVLARLIETAKAVPVENDCPAEPADRKG